MMPNINMRRLKIILIIGLYAFSVQELTAQLDKKAPWPMFHQNLRHTGQKKTNIISIQKNPAFKMITNFSSGNMSSPVISSNGIIYISDCANGNLFAFTNDAIKWKFETTSYIYASPAIAADGTIIIGNDNSAHSLYAINPDGTWKWTYTNNSANPPFRSSVAIDSSNTVYCGDYSGKFMALTNGKIKWTNNLGGIIYLSTPSIGTSRLIYICSGTYLYALTNTTGQIKWSVPLGYNTYSSPAIGSDNTIYAARSSFPGLFAVTNGQVKWTNTSIGYCVSSSPGIGPDGTIYIGCMNNSLYAIDPANGNIKWNRSFGNYIYSSPVIGSDGTIYIGSDDGNLYAVSNISGNLKWRCPIGNPIQSTPTLYSNGSIYISAQNGKFYRVFEDHEPVLSWTSNTSYSNDGVLPDNGINGFDFRFEIKYLDQDNDKPSTNMVWVDCNDDGIYQNIEKFAMSSNSGTSYTNGIIFTNVVRVYYSGDGIINYQFHFTDKYGYPALSYHQISNHILTVTNTNIAHQLIPAINTNYSGIFNSYTSNIVLSVRIWDTKHGHMLTRFALSNAGTMVYRTDYSNVRLWLDRNNNFQLDAADIHVTNLQWSSTGLLTNTINLNTNLSYPRNFLVAIDLTTNATLSNSFKACIPASNLRCSGLTNAPLAMISNSGFLKIGAFLSLTKNIDFNYSTSTFLNNQVLSVHIKGLTQSLLKKIKIGNTGTMVNGTDISRIRLWLDANSSFGYDGSDLFIGDLSWDNSQFWTNNNISFNSNLWDYNQFIITVDFASSVKGNRTFRPYFPINGVSDNYKTIPANSITNNGYVTFINGFSLMPFNTRPNAYGAPAMESGDINNDGYKDILVSGYDGSIKYIDKYINNRGGSFNAPISFDNDWDDDRDSIAMADFNNDGYLDFAKTDPIYLRVFLNRGDATFNEYDYGVSSGVILSCIRSGDVDGDGDMDIITTGRTTLGIDLFINDGSGAFSPAPIHFGNGLDNSSIALGDIDNNGSLDLIVTGTYSSLYILEKYLNDGYGNYTGPITINAAGVQFGAISLGDLNGDGNLDFIVSGNGRLDKYLNDGTGNFTGPTSFGTGISVAAQALGDINNDGSLDLIVAGVATIYTNDGIGNLSLYSTLPFNLGYNGQFRGILVLNDMDNDGDLDLIYSGHNSGGTRQFGIFINTTPNSNKPPTVPSNLKATNNNGFWKFSWDGSSDDHTGNKVLRYKIAIRTNTLTGNYNYISTNFNFPFGQANLGNVCIITSHSYQSTIPINNKVFYKVSAIDTSFKNSVYSSESISVFPLIHNVTKSLDYGKFYYALTEASKGDHIQADPWTYREQVKISKMTNILLEATSWANSHLKTNTIIAPTNKSYAVKFTNSKNVTFQGFTVKSATNGIFFQNCQQNYIQNNLIFSNKASGIRIQQADGQKILTNTVCDNPVGILINNSTSSTLFRNAILAQTGHGISLNTANNNALINNTIASNGTANGDNIYLNNSANNLIKNNIIVFARNGYGVNRISGAGNSLSYNDSFGNSLGNYFNILPGIGTITNDPLSGLFNIYASNLLTIPFNSPCIDKGDPADSAAPEGNNRIDMGWKEFTDPFVSLNIQKTISNIRLPSALSSEAVPGACIAYKINCTINSYGNKPATNIILIDRIRNDLAFYTNYTYSAGWILEYSTNTIPDQNYVSADYFSTYPSKDKVKWIRWKKDVSGSATDAIYIKTVIK